MQSVALIVTIQDDGFEVVDNLGRRHSVSSEGLADLCRELSHDEALPAPHLQNVESAQLEFAVTQLTQDFLPDGLSFLARPAVVTLKNTIHALLHPRDRNLHVRRG